MNDQLDEEDEEVDKGEGECPHDEVTRMGFGRCRWSATRAARGARGGLAWRRGRG